VCTRIDVTVLADGSCRVSDDGRGIPSKNPSIPVNRRGNRIHDTARRWKFGGGDTRCRAASTRGRSIVNALSTSSFSKSTATTSTIKLSFKDGGKPQGKLSHGTAPRGRTGTSVTFTPESDDFRRRRLSCGRPSLSDCRYGVLECGLEFDSLTNAWDAVKRDVQVQRRIVDYVRPSTTRGVAVRKVGFYEQTSRPKVKWPSSGTRATTRAPLVRERHRDH